MKIIIWNVGELLHGDDVVVCLFMMGEQGHASIDCNVLYFVFVYVLNLNVG